MAEVAASRLVETETTSEILGERLTTAVELTDPDLPEREPRFGPDAAASRPPDRRCGRSPRRSILTGSGRYPAGDGSGSSWDASAFLAIDDPLDVLGSN